MSRLFLDPSEPSKPNTFQRRGQRGDIPLPVLAENFRGGDGQTADEVFWVLVNTELHRIVRMIDPADRIRAVFLRAEQIEFAGTQFNHERAFGREGVRARFPSKSDNF